MSRTLTDGVRRCSAVERQGRAESGFAGSACVPPAGAEKGCERMRIWKVVPAAPEHIPDLAAGMREADRREVWASHRHTPVQALTVSLENSALAWTCLVENAGVSRDASSGFASGSGAGPKSPAPSPESSPSSPDAKLPHFQAMRPAFMWGVCRLGSILSDRGSPWLLGADAIRLVHREFLRQCPDYVARMQERFPRLENVVHAENRLSIRWLRWCGFTVDDAPTPINGESFFTFWRESHV